MRGAWLVKGDPSRNDFASMLVPGATQPWFTKKPPKHWKVGDKMVLWASAPAKCVVGLATLVDVSKPDRGTTTFTLEYATKRLSASVGIDVLRKDELVGGSSFLKAGPAATVHRLTSTEMMRLLELVGEGTPTYARKAERWITAVEEAETTDTLRVLSVRAAFAHAIVVGEKDVENRSWRPPPRVVGSWIVIHASAKLLDDDIAACKAVASKQSNFERSKITSSAIVGIAHLASCTDSSSSRWYYPGEIAWNIDDVVRLKRPIPIMGKLGLWRLPAEVKAKLLSQLPQRVLPL